ncbi:hypothetical protein F5Y08DRAFT_101185 [Xylaria arbuscula]|nr:hypothetical protein F5Y08DRAFT_101185 [Xylaria arbuscula]
MKISPIIITLLSNSSISPVHSSHRRTCRIWRHQVRSTNPSSRRDRFSKVPQFIKNSLSGCAAIVHPMGNILETTCNSQDLCCSWLAGAEGFWRTVSGFFRRVLPTVPSASPWPRHVLPLVLDVLFSLIVWISGELTKYAYHSNIWNKIFANSSSLA